MLNTPTRSAAAATFLVAFACAAGPTPPPETPTAVPAAAPVENSEQRIAVSLVSDHAAVAPGGSFTLAAECKVDASWHTYWPGINDTGLPATFDLSLPSGWTADAPRWPAPTRHVSPGDLLDHVLEGDFTVLIKVHVPQIASTDAAHTLRLRAEWLVCDKVCLMEESTSQLSIRVSPQPSPDTAVAERLRAAQAAVPAASLPQGVTVTASNDALNISWPGATSLEFYPTDTGATYTDLLKHGVSQSPGKLSVPFEAHTATHAAGVVRAMTRRAGMVTSETIEIRTPIPPTPGKTAPK